jgi:hypothetical protein
VLSPDDSGTVNEDDDGHRVTHDCGQGCERVDGITRERANKMSQLVVLYEGRKGMEGVVVKREADRPEASGAVLPFQAAEELGCLLAMRTSGEHELEQHDLSAVSTEPVNRSSVVCEGQLRCCPERFGRRQW